MEDLVFEELKKLFKGTGFRIYMVGGTVRDLLLGLKVADYDFVTDATPDEMKGFLPGISSVFAKFGCVRMKISGYDVDITTLREEGEYDDSRHPSYVKFVKDLEIDYRRRDFTINGMYIDEDYKLIDLCGGLSDLNNKIIRFIGDPETRIKEDPLRILRAKRFAMLFGFEIEEKSKKALEMNMSLLEKLNPEKIKEEERKAKRSII